MISDIDMPHSANPSDTFAVVLLKQDSVGLSAESVDDHCLVGKA